MFFAVKRTLKIGNKRYLPCVCYELTNSLLATVEELVAKDWAYTSEKYMVFEGGKRIDNLPKKPKTVKAETVVAPKAEPVKPKDKVGF